jgi:hypothetical protein
MKAKHLSTIVLCLGIVAAALGAGFAVLLHVWGAL